MADATEAYFAEVGRAGLWSSRAALRRYLDFLFRGVPLRGARVLDVGGGTGLFTMYAAAAGAAEVVCLEPEAEGGSSGMNDQFRRLHDALGRPNVRLVPDTLQNFNPPPRSFDVVLLQNSINHVEEDACTRLHHDEAAREKYRKVFRKVAAIATHGAHLVITDCTRRNLFPMLGLKHPLAPTIEWHKHQPPEMWRGLLEDVGFRDAHVGWSSFNRLGPAGWLLFANRVGAFFLTGHFRLHMRNADGQARPTAQGPT
jgi:SAM-dependent methyltransferase